MKKYIWVVLVILVIMIISVGLSKFENENRGSLRIGVAIPLTGIASVVGESEKNGIDLAVKEINQSGGINGRSIEVVFEDDHTDPKQTVGAVQKLINIDGATVLIGGTWDFLANAVIPVIDSQKKILITPSALPDTLEKTSPYLFVTHSPVALLEGGIVKFLANFSRPRVVTISVNNLWGKAHLATFSRAISVSGGTLLKEVIVPNFDGNDIQRELTIIKSLKPDVIISALNFADSVSLLRRRSELNIPAKILADFHVEDGFNKGNIPNKLLSGVNIFVFSDASQDFFEKYQKMYGQLPNTYADTAYDAVYVIKQAVENAYGKTDTESLVQGIHSINNFKGASGILDFSKNNYPSNKLPIVKIFKDGKFVEVK
jgi:branched-chain amino acid transport system substrate-binding protein